MPIRPRLRFINIYPFPGGFTTRAAHTAAQGFSKLENWWHSLDDFGAIEVVPGFSPLTSTAITSSGADFWIRTIAYAEKSDLTRLKFVTGDTGAWTVTDAGVATSIKTGLTADQRFSIVVAEDLALFFNGSDTPFKHNFTSVSDIGLTQPTLGGATSAISASAIAEDQNVKGVVKYFVSFMTSTTEGPLSDAFGEIDAGNGNAIDLSTIPTGGGGVTARVLYRTFREAEEPFRLAVIEDNTTTTFTDTKADSDLGGLADKHGAPPVTAKYALTHFNRVWISGEAANPNRVYWSDRFEPESYFGENFVSIFESDGDQITGLARSREGIYVFKENHIYKILGRDPAVESLQVLEITIADQNNRNLGTPSHWSIAATPNGHFFYYRGGFYMLEGCGEIRYLSRTIEDEIKNDINFSQEHLANSVYDPDTRIAYCSIPVNSSTLPNRTYGYVLDTGEWFRLSEGFLTMTVVEKGTDTTPPDSFEVWASRSGSTESTVTKKALVQELFDSSIFTFDGDAIVATAEFHPIYSATPSNLSRWLHVELEHDVEASGSVDVTYKLESEPTGTTVNVPLTRTGTLTRWKSRVNIGLQATEAEFIIKFNGGNLKPKLYGMNIALQDMGVHNVG